MNYPTYEHSIKQLDISTEVLSMVPQRIIEERWIMPIEFKNGTLSLVTSKFIENYSDIKLLENTLQEINKEILKINLLSVSYKSFSDGYHFHYKQSFTPTVSNNENEQENTNTKITSEQTKLADEILQKAIIAKASDIHITPWPEGSSKVSFRIDGKIYDTGIILNKNDAITICNIYKRNSGLDVNNLIGQDGRFTFLGKDFRLSTQPYGNDAISNKIVLRILGISEEIPTLESLSFSNEEVKTLKKIIHKPSGIFLVCGPTGEGKSTTLYSCIKELADTTNGIITTVEDPIEKYIAGISQTQVRLAENENSSLTFGKVLRSMLRQDPNIIMVGEIRDKDTAITAVQGSQTGHFILSTLHVRNSISVFQRLSDMGVNVSGFTEQIVGISSQRLVSRNCPNCRKKIISPYNYFLRQQDLDILEKCVDDNGNQGYISYTSTGCEECNHTGFKGRIPIIEIIEFNNFLRDYFSEKHGLIQLEKYLRDTIQFKSLWDKGIALVADGTISLEELLNTIEPDIDLMRCED